MRPAPRPAPSPPRLPRQRWHLPTVAPALVEDLAQATGLPPLLAQVLVQRGLVTPEQATDFLNPERLQLPSPLIEFPDLAVSLELLVEAIATQQAIAICGDYDADGMTSTALLLRALRHLGGQVNYIIPSRMTEGYGLNQRIVEDCYANGVSLILTVDNGIAACAPIQRARELGLAVVVTDHHDIPPELPPANAILNPKLLPEQSPYRGVAGVGVAYILAVCLAQALDQTQDLTAPLLELFTLGTIADLAPLTGVNRRWVRRGLGLLPRSRILGIQALIQVAGLADQSKPLKPEHIGFRLGPRINAVGRISDPQIVIDLLTTDDVGTALERAMQCEQINAARQDLCQQIEQEAVAWCERQQQAGSLDWEQDRVLLLVQPNWHHGVIGIVASRLVERYGVPVFIGTYEDEEGKVIRGSARGIPEFDVFEALQSCSDLMEKLGGHRAAGGFSFLTKHLRQVQSRLVRYAHQRLSPELLKPLIAVDAQAALGDITQALYDQIDQLHPCGIENPDPVFWTPQVRVIEQQVVGRNQEHLKLVLGDREGRSKIKAIAWRWGEYYPLPEQVDIAYKLKQNEWQGLSTVELELVGVRAGAGEGTPAVGNSVTQGTDPPRPLVPTGRIASPPSGSPEPRPQRQSPGPLPGPTLPELPTPGVDSTAARSGLTADSHPGVEFSYSQRRYWVSPSHTQNPKELTISNPEGQVLRVHLGDRQGSLELPGQAPRSVDISETFYANLIQASGQALEIQRLHQLLREKEAQLVDQARQIQNLTDQLNQIQASPGAASSQSSAQPWPAALATEPTPAPVQESPLASPNPPPSREAPPVDRREGLVDSQAIRQQVRTALGDQVWFCLAGPSQQDLCHALYQQTLIKAQPHPEDFSAAALALGKALEREILDPLLVGLREYGQQTGDGEMAALATTLCQQPSLGALPALLAESWKAISEKALQATTKPRRGLHQTITAEDWAVTDAWVNDTHRVLLDEFLQGWDHPIATWMVGANEAAAALAQVHQLHHRAAAAGTMMPEWQFQLLHQLVLGKRQAAGILQKVFGS
ncbi:MAG TPA: single-stranded-DNA-specific exonuclease RecJ [Leptolyngbyaceae cyanobacterium M65_K2018_010]|nr:single-stranded-DNA-specific exonuclease RecJ [Leptolyngbyaceae cyanobacterium M65_K2018_010]